MLRTEPHEDRTGRCAPYRILPEQGRQTEGRVRAALPHGHGRRRSPRLCSCTAFASASTSATAPTFSLPLLVRPGGGGGMNRLMGVGVNAHWGLELELISPLPDPAAARGGTHHPSSGARREPTDHGAAMSAEDEISDNRRGHHACAARKAAPGIGCFPTHWLQELL
ncbi:hypothetical protein EDB85DRAFT_298661 [Lactarius pseudohatsudake]|nr:hypothetical protein EDB85DRAFT_298661 [Lactarius pseudohatsudake]